MYFLLYNYTSCFILQLIPRENYDRSCFSLYRVSDYYYSAAASATVIRCRRAVTTTAAATISGTCYTSTRAATASATSATA
jgi:hypothetical protein